MGLNALDPRGRRRAGLILGLLFLATAALAVIAPPRRGLRGSYFLNRSWTGAPNTTTRERRIGLDRLRLEYPSSYRNVSILWMGAIFIETPGVHEFATLSGGASDIRIDDRIVADNAGDHDMRERSGSIELGRGFHAIVVRCSPGRGPFQAFWAPPGKARRDLSTSPLFDRPSVHPSAFRVSRVRQAVLPVLLVVWLILLGGLILASPEALAAAIPRPRWNPVLIKLIAFFLANGLALNLLLSLFSERTVLDLTRFTVTSPFHSGEDSWRQIANALDYLGAPHERTLYAEVFFAQRHKFQYPPTSLLLLEPMRWLPYPKFVLAANIVSWAAILASSVFLALLLTRALVRSYPGPPGDSGGEKGARLALALGLTLTFYPLVRSFELGQIQTWLYFFFVLALWAWTGGRKMLAGALIGVICAIKPQLGLLILWGGLRREWRFVAGAAATAGTLGLLSLAVFGWANHVDYLRALSYMARHGESFFTNQSVNGLLNRLAFNGTNLHGNPRAFAPYVPWIYWATLASSIVLIAAALLRKRGGSQETRDADFLAAAVTFTIASPIAWEHHYSILLPVFAVALPLIAAGGRGSKRGRLWALGLAFVLTADMFVGINALANTRWNFLQSHLFFGALALIALLYGAGRDRGRKPAFPDVSSRGRPQ